MLFSNDILKKMNIQPWALSVAETIEQLHSTLIGITDKEAETRLIKYGNNTFHGKEKLNKISLFLKQFLSPLIFLLIGAGILTFILDEWVETVVIILAVFLNVVLGFYHEYHAENTLDRLTTYIKDRTRVIRNGIEQEIDSSILVSGDVIKLSYGARVPADARILTINDFSVDEAILTGESMPVNKSEESIALSALVAERKNIAHAGSLVVQGYATAIVYGTGNETEIGKIANVVSETTRTKTPLQKSIGYLAWLIFFGVSIIVFLILILGIIRGEPLIPMLLLSAAVAVGAVPEALPVVLTIILAIGSERIANKKGIVRKLTAAETLGSSTLIMTDKTGTLTLADMQLVGIHSKATLVSEQIHKKEATTAYKFFSADQKQLLELALLNIDVSIENRGEDKAKWVFRGRPFEVNIAKACRSHHISLDIISSLVSSIILPFNSTNKFSVAEKDGSYVVMGAPDILLSKSNISKEEYLKIESWINETSREGKRLIGIASIEKKHKKHFSVKDIKNLDFLGVFTFYDPVRPLVSGAIKNIESHGVKMVLVTGDLVGTAISVAKSLDWEVSEEEIITGVDLQNLSDKQLLTVIPKIKIFARVTPEDKLRIGQLYQNLGEIVAMTGDGVNDAPALKAMNIGISLGSGSDVAKSASDLVLLDDNFETISLAIDEGRRILSNIRKAFTYLMSNSFDEVFVIGGSLLVGLPLPITALQIIWVNLFTGSLPALAFAFDEDMDKEKRKGTGVNLIFTKSVKMLIFGVGITSSFLLFLLYYCLVKIGFDIALVRSVFFVCFSSYILAISFSFRSLNHPLFSYAVFSNKKLNWSIIIAIAILILTMKVEAIRNVFELAPLPLSWMPFIIFWIILNILLVEGAKFLLSNKNHFFTKEYYLKLFRVK
ncbi:MAG: Calcium-translocating P-type ATPase, PMCA-type [Parcubacteria group bacterium GW2011_GWB1_36_5]|nr:MAG: Calcium-translocating P-type ATPase, PMCA-type [Parcubacteria group bacterium GW2011_GWB1_36_5]